VKQIALDNRTLAGAALALAVLAALLAVLGATRSGAAGADERAAAIGEGRRASLTVSLPQAATDPIYAAPGAAGRPIVVLDAGHGGSDPGARGVSGAIYEKQLTLALARELRDTLVKRGRVRVAMTRDDDRYLALEDRALVSRRLNASLFVSLHMDSAPNPLARGASIYSLSDVASDAEAARLAASQNEGVPEAAVRGNVRSLLADLVARDHMGASADFAVRLVAKSAGRIELRPDPHRFAAFHVLRSARTGAVLFEAGYVSNTDDELLLRSPDYRSKIVLALAQAIEADVAARARRS
jgi:N-acetylmuramoyl-L-alanine amidase